MDFTRKTLFFYGENDNALICENQNGRYTLACKNGQGTYAIRWDDVTILLAGEYKSEESQWLIGVMPENNRVFPDWNIRWKGTKHNSPVAEITLPQEARVTDAEHETGF